MECLLDVLVRGGVPKAHTAHRWPVDVVTQILRDRAGVELPIRSGMSGSEAAAMVRRLRAAETGMWSYETTSTRNHVGTYTVSAYATRMRPSKLASQKRAPFTKAPIGEDEMDFPTDSGSQDTRGRNNG